MSLTDTMCKAAKPKEKHYKLSDSGGLYLRVSPNGSKHWQLKYRYLKKEKKLAIGAYPFTTLAEARIARDAAKKQLIQGVDPSSSKKAEQKELIRNAENTFKALALEWHAIQKTKWSEKHGENILHKLKTDLFPYIGTWQADQIDAPELLTVLRKIEDRNALDLAARCRQICGQIFRYGILVRKCKHNPAADLSGALKTRAIKHFASIEPDDIPKLLKAIDDPNFRLYPRTRRAIKLSLLTFVRPGELRQWKWDEINFDKNEWLLPEAKMKMKRQHIVPLSKQALKLLKEQKKETEHLRTDFVFPSQKNPLIPMSDGTVNVALNNIGFESKMTAHGFRALARTAIREELDYEPDVIEMQLAHKPAGPLGATYDRAKFLKKRHKMMQDWADYIDRL